MTEVSTIGLDLAKNVFQAHGASAAAGGPEREAIFVICREAPVT